jgi:hypothetical protein
MSTYATFNRSIAMTPEEGNRLGIINKSTLWYHKKNLAQGKTKFASVFSKIKATK